MWCFFSAPRCEHLNPVLISSRQTSASFRLGNCIRYSDVLSASHLAPRTVAVDTTCNDVFTMVPCSLPSKPWSDSRPSSTRFRLRIYGNSSTPDLSKSGHGFTDFVMKLFNFRLGISNRFSVGKLQPLFGAPARFLLRDCQLAAEKRLQFPNRKTVVDSQPKTGRASPRNHRTWRRSEGED